MWCEMRDQAGAYPGTNATYNAAGDATVASDSSGVARWTNMDQHGPRWRLGGRLLRRSNRATHGHGRQSAAQLPMNRCSVEVTDVRHVRHSGSRLTSILSVQVRHSA